MDYFLVSFIRLIPSLFYFFLIMGLPAHCFANIFDHLIAFYSCNENIQDTSLNRHNGSDINLIFTKDRFGYEQSACQFTGNNHIVIQSLKNVNWKNQFTLSLWFKLTNRKQSHLGIVNTGNQLSSGWGVIFKNEINRTKLFAYIVTEQNPQPFGLYSQLLHDFEKWHHFAMTYDGEYMTVYLDGIATEQIFLNSGNIIQSEYPVVIGQLAVNMSDTTFHGLLDDLYLFDYSLTSDQMNKLYKESCLLCTQFIESVIVQVKKHSHHAGFDEGLNFSMKSCQKKEKLDASYKSGYIDGYMVGRYDGYHDGKQESFADGYIVGRHDGLNDKSDFTPSDKQHKEAKLSQIKIAGNEIKKIKSLLKNDCSKKLSKIVKV